MKKIIGLMLVVILLASTTLAVNINRTSIRAKDGKVNYVGDDTIFDFSKVKFSAYFREDYNPKNIDQGQGGLQLVAITSSGERIVLNIGMDLKTVIINSNDRLYIDNTADGIYWKKGNKPQELNFNTLRYDYNKITGLVNIAGESIEGINFRVTGMEVK